MHESFHRLRRLQIALTCVLLVVAGGVLIAVGKSLGDDAGSWLGVVPWSELGGVLVGAGLLSVWLDALFRRDQDAADDYRLRTILEEQAPAMRDAVLRAFAADHEDLKRVATPQMLDQLITNSLALRLDDPQFAAEVYADIRDQAIRAPERWHNASIDIALAPHPHSSYPTKTPDMTSDLLSVTVRWEYTTIPVHEERRFTALSDRTEYSEIASQGGPTSAWFIKPGQGIDAADRDDFELLQFSVDGEPRAIRRSARRGGQTYAVSIGHDVVKAGQAVTVAYTYRTVTRASGHLLYFDIEQPTRGLSVTLDYENTDIDSVSVLDLLPSVQAPTIERSPDAPTPRSIRVEVSGWVFPRSGVGFVWVREGERRR